MVSKIRPLSHSSVLFIIHQLQSFNNLRLYIYYAVEKFLVNNRRISRSSKQPVPKGFPHHTCAHISCLIHQHIQFPYPNNTITDYNLNFGVPNYMNV
jgi:ABC-type transport system involved in cytochrome bd biosynthesis fused ATPase/permease subunit